MTQPAATRPLRGDRPRRLDHDQPPGHAERVESRRRSPKSRQRRGEPSPIPHIGLIVVTGAGEKAFVAGADITEMAALDARGAQAFAHELHESFAHLESSGKPVIAAINGFALGGGCELALACHVRIASDTARFGQPEVGFGLIPGAGGTQRLSRLIGRGRALDLILSGDMIDAAEALRIGLVERVTPAATLREYVSAYAAKLLGKSPLAQSRALDAVHRRR